MQKPAKLELMPSPAQCRVDHREGLKLKHVLVTLSNNAAKKNVGLWVIALYRFTRLWIVVAELADVVHLQTNEIFTCQLALWVHFYLVFTTRRKRGLCCRPASVRLSFTLVYCIQTAEDILKLLCQPVAPTF